MNNKVLIIAGPTASGKKKLSHEIARRFGCEIVSADSRKVYRYLDIGTAKPSPADMKEIKHHLIDIINPDSNYSAGDWAENAGAVIDDIIKRGHLPLISGGTGFYIGALKDGLNRETEVVPEIRERVQGELEEKGIDYLYGRLSEIDPERAAQVSRNDAFRITRALEIFESTGKKVSELKSAEKRKSDYDFLSIAVSMPRETLYEKISERADKMLEAGLIGEIEKILGMGYSKNIPAFNTVGYQEWIPYLENETTFEQSLDKMKQNSRRYAKRQLTWFRAKNDMEWYDITDCGTFEKIENRILKWLSE